MYKEYDQLALQVEYVKKTNEKDILYLRGSVKNNCELSHISYVGYRILVKFGTAKTDDSVKRY